MKLISGYFFLFSFPFGTHNTCFNCEYTRSKQFVIHISVYIVQETKRITLIGTKILSYAENVCVKNHIRISRYPTQVV